SPNQPLLSDPCGHNKPGQMEVGEVLRLSADVERRRSSAPSLRSLKLFVGEERSLSKASF
ncbi:hypothetical protein XENOCAPTIV_025948, partial [Xenoophorus captivus]